MHEDTLRDPRCAQKMPPPEHPQRSARPPPLRSGGQIRFYEGGVASETPEAWIAITDFLFRTIAAPAAK